MHAAKRPNSTKIRENLSKGISAKIYTLEIYRYIEYHTVEHNVSSTSRVCLWKKPLIVWRSTVLIAPRDVHDKTTTLGECNQHLENCLFVEVSCTNNCGERMLRKELQDHEDNKCPNRLVLCQYCEREGMHKDVTAESHLDKCAHFPISCCNCGHKKIKRKNLAGHQNVCPLQPWSVLSLKLHGCREMILRKHLAA